MTRLSKTLAVAAVALAAFTLAPAARAGLAAGDKAPDFTAPAYLGGNPFTFKLADALKKGPVVIYFYPAAYTMGCQIEAHLFAEAADDFKKEGATVIGVTAGNTDMLQAFSNDTQYCSGKFAMAADTDLKIATSYKSLLAFKPGVSDRTSYVVAPNGKIVLAYSDLRPDDHVSKTLAAVKQLHDEH